MTDYSRQLDSHAIEGALRQGDAASRAISLNLIIVGANQVNELLERVAGVFPCRAIVIDLGRRRPAARVSTGPRWECVRLAGPPSQLNLIASTAAALAMPGLPISAWWPDATDLEAPLFNHLVDLADRIVLDSARSGESLAYLKSLARLVKEKQSVVSFADMSWSRIYGWRLLVARLFDAPADRANLAQVGEVTIGHGGNLAEPLLLAGWLSSRLGWELRPWPRSKSLPRNAPARLVASTGARDLSIHLKPRRAQPGLASLVIQAGDARYRVEREEGGVCSVVQGADGREVADVCVPDSKEIDLLAAELGGYGRDRIYAESVEALVSLIGPG